MIEIQAILKNPRGLHARPSRDIALKAQEYRSYITLHSIDEKEEVCAKEIIALMSSAFLSGDAIIVCASGPDECIAALEIAHLLESLEY